MERKKDNAHRLAAILGRYAEDPRTVERMAAILNYLPAQLREDMESIGEYIAELENAQEGP